ncbi:MAG: SOS response-associated peptidase [Candidatus Riflebacteria bacterium]
MCGRFSLTGSLIWLIRLLQLEEINNFRPRYNISPGQPLLVFLHDPDRNVKRYDFHTWGFIPYFSKGPKDFRPMINARCESIREKPSFKKAFEYRRCLIPASGFYEWQKTASGKQPWYFSPVDNDEIWYFAGIWDIWHGEGGEQVNSCAIITTSANELVGKIHNRMPVIIQARNVLPWLDSEADPSDLLKLLRPMPASTMRSWQVDRRVNNPVYEDSSCIKPAGDYQPTLFDF